MKNTRLQILLERAPITDEDRHNISRIFSVLSHHRQQELLHNWDEYIVRFVSIKECMEEEECRRFLEGLNALDTLLDEAIIREQEKQQKKEIAKQSIRDELESTVAYEQMKKLKKIKELQQSPV